MSVENPFDTADVLSVDTSQGEVRLTVGDAVRGRGRYADLPQYGPDGFIGIPNVPSANGDAAQAFYAVDGYGRIVLGTRDNRFASKIGTGSPGDRMIVTDGEARFLIKQETDSVSIYTINQKTGQSMMVNLNGEDGVVTITNGGAITTMVDDEIVMAVDGGGAIRMYSGGVTIRGSAVHIAADKVFLGQLPNGGPPPISPLTAVGIGASPAVVPSTKVFALV